MGRQTQTLLPHPMAQEDQGAGSPGAPSQQLRGEQASFVTHHKGPSATPQLPQWLFLPLWGAWYVWLQCRHHNHHHQYNVLGAG